MLSGQRSGPLTRTNAVARKDNAVREEEEGEDGVGGGKLIIVPAVWRVRSVLTPLSRHIRSHPPGSRFSTQLRDEMNH